MLQYLIGLIVIVLLIAIGIFLIMILPRPQNFHDIPDCAILARDALTDDNSNIDEAIQSEIDGINDSEWIPYPDNKNRWIGKYSIYPLWMFGCNSFKRMAKCPIITDMARSFGDMETAALIKIHPETSLEKHKMWKSTAERTMRCVIPLHSPSDDIHTCNIWVNGGTHKMENGQPFVYDSSKKCNFANLDYDPCVALIVDIPRPEDAMKSNSNEPDLTPKTLIDFIKKF